MKCYLPRVYDSVLIPLSRLIILLLIVLPFSSAESQILDTLFGNHGTVMNLVSNGTGNGDVANSVLVQADGKIIAAGSAIDAYSSYTFALARYKTDGTLDSTFGTDGSVRTNFDKTSIERGYGIALQPDDKIILVGSSLTDFVAFGIARYNTDGSLDNTFGTNGTVRTYLNGSNGAADQANCVALQTDGKIVVAGITHYLFNYGQFGVARYDKNGNLDSTFGTNGITRFFINGGSTMDDACYSIALQKDGKIVLAGSSYAYTDSTRYAFGLARLNVDGTLDTTFGVKGSVMTHIGSGGYYSSTSGDFALSVALQSDEKIVTAGYSLDKNGHYSFAVVRYNTNGTLDTTFGFHKTGIVLTHILGGNGTGDFGRAAVIQPNGKIVVAGSCADALNHVSFAVARYRPDGILDYQFGAGESGTVREFINGGTSADEALSLALQQDGKIVLAGESKDAYTTHEFSLARIMPQEIGVSVEARPLSVPGKFELEQNYPNPFNPSTNIEYRIANTGIVSLKLYDILGREVATLVNEQKQPGRYSVPWDAGRQSSGIYFCRMKAGQFVKTMKLLLVK